ncbi:zinc ribbon domain-containing protein [Geomonas terrae]|uniref:Zinc ribbon domain-containing protein n=1 Tax=Geomonas terrae TaxID=2562681 RepID=A0A4S1CFE8_9BACT|nr:zinc ribbon domain-containing protein [Geomonas terrae]TGU72234.1 zinc ribbon domain-containing protein [Geomonas terrae]
MICPKCAHAQPDGTEVCLRCGVIFAKVRVDHSASQSPPTSIHEGTIEETPGGMDTLQLAGRLVIWAILLVWGGKFIFMPISGEDFSRSYMHLVNLPFHEAGHVIFAPFGRFIQVLGGTLGQWLMPAVVTASFLRRKDHFAATVGVWWLGQSFMDIAPYMDDARAGQLMLLGGVTGSEVEDYHDWEIILTRLGLLQYDHVIARISFFCGTLFMIGGLAWGAGILYRQIQSRRRPI